MRTPLVTRLKHGAYIALRAPLRGRATAKAASWIQAETEAFDVEAVRPALGDSTFLIVTFGNAAYLDFLFNWHGHVARLDIANYLVVALDGEAHARLSNAGLRSHLLCGAAADRASFANYGQRAFNRITARKILFVLLLLRHGIDVLLTDADTIWLRDPAPALAHAADIQIQVDNQAAFVVDQDILRHPNVNTGFYLARSNERTVRFFTDVLTSLELHPRFNDQNAANWELRRSARSTVLLPPETPLPEGARLSVRLLDPLLFPNGSVFFREQEHYAAMGARPIMVHANWIHGRAEKIRCLSERGWWNVSGSP